MPLNGNHLDSGLTAGTRSAIISFVFICCSIICCNGCCQKQPHAGPQWHTWSPKLWSACWAAVPDSLRSPWHSAAGGKKRHYIVNSMKGTVSHVETSEGVCVWRRGRCVWLVSACRWCSCLDVSMRSDPDWTSSAQEPLPELINQLLQGTDVAVCVHACVGGVSCTVATFFFEMISKQDSSFAEDIWECFGFGVFFSWTWRTDGKKTNIGIKTRLLHHVFWVLLLFQGTLVFNHWHVCNYSKCFSLFSITRSFFSELW